MRTIPILPRHISRTEEGSLLVRVCRQGVLFHCTIHRDFPDALAEAVRRRDHFLRLAGPPAPTYSRVRSNTGIAGISETTAWRKSRPYPVFNVDWYEGRRHVIRKIRYGNNGVPRELALEQAKALRARMAGPLRCHPTLAYV